MAKLLTGAQLAAYPKYPSEWTLARWRRENIGPPYQRIMGRIFYDLAEVEQWEQSKRGGGREIPNRKKSGRKRKARLNAMPGMLTMAQLARIPGFPCVATLNKLRREGSGPAFVEIESRCVCSMAEAARWLDGWTKRRKQPENQAEMPSAGLAESQDDDAGQ